MQYQAILSLALVLGTTSLRMTLSKPHEVKLHEKMTKVTEEFARDYSMITGDGKDTINVLCIGDSITSGYKGDGSYVQNPYPAQLFGRLNDMDPNKNYWVDNQGAGGATMISMKPGTGGCTATHSGQYSYWNSDSFQNVMHSKPDIVTIALGINDADMKQHGGCDSPESWEQRYEEDYVEMVKQLQTLVSYHNQQPDIYLLTPTPVTRGDLSPLNGSFLPILQRVQEKTGVKGVVDLNSIFADGSWHDLDGVHPPEEMHTKVADAIVGQIKKDIKADKKNTLGWTVKLRSKSLLE